MDVLPTLDKHSKPMVAVKNSPVWPDLQRTLLTWYKRRFQLAGREAPEEFEFDPIQTALGVQERKLGRAWRVHGLLLCRMMSMT